jgi:hypothetical protein
MRVLQVGDSRRPWAWNAAPAITRIDALIEEREDEAQTMSIVV